MPVKQVGRPGGRFMDWLTQAQPLLATLIGVAGLLFLILVRGVNAFAALLVAALATGLMAGMAPASVIESITSGMGGTLGFIAVIVGLGTLLGTYLEASGGAAALARSIIGERKPTASSVAMGVVGLIVAIPVFFDVGLILLISLVKALAQKARKHSLYFGLPLLAGLATAHAFIPPTPGPVAVAEILSAELGLVIVAGLLAGIPAMLIAGPVFAHLADSRGWLPAFVPSEAEGGERFDPALARKAIAAILIPLVLIVAAAIAKATAWEEGTPAQMLAFVGHPFVALLLACGATAILLRPADNAGRERLIDALTRAFEPAAVILLVTGAGGAFKQVLVDTGAGKMIAEGLLGFGIAPLVAAFLLAAIVRVAQGSATVAMLTAAGFAAPIAASAGLAGWDLALMTIAIAAGASVASHVNDSGFWLVSRYFGITEAETLKSWTIASSLVGLTGFAMVLLLAALT